MAIDHQPLISEPRLPPPAANQYLRRNTFPAETIHENQPFRDNSTPVGSREHTFSTQGSPHCLPNALYGAKNLNPCRHHLAPGEEQKWEWGVSKPEGPRMLSPEAHLQLSLACCRTQMANERTFLAWVRTCCSLLVLGIAIDKIADRGTEMTALGFIMCAVCGSYYSQSRYRFIKRELRKIYPNEIITPATVRWFLVMFMVSVVACVSFYFNDVVAASTGVSVIPTHLANFTSIAHSIEGGNKTIAAAAGVVSSFLI